jgi:hypothetical protein
MMILILYEFNNFTKSFALRLKLISKTYLSYSTPIESLLQIAKNLIPVLP